jgi:GNAT superfamily N-acetyltransferase
MSSILHFRKQLALPPVAVDAAGILVRRLIVPDDIQAWLKLRDRAMAGEAPVVRPWTEADVRREFLDKLWWRDEHAWVAAHDDAANEYQLLAGAVILGCREGAESAVPVVHWLLVDPTFRRRGVGRALMSRLERAAWDAGWREVQLETHAGWASAVAFYHSMGYAPVRERSPR